MKNCVRICIIFVLFFVLNIGVYTESAFAGTALELPITGVNNWNYEQLTEAEKMTNEEWYEFFKNQAEQYDNMTDEQWDQYYKNTILFTVDDLYEDSISTEENEERYDKYYSLFESVYGIYLVQENRYNKILNNYPNLDGANIKINGEFIDFGKDKPIDVEWVTFIPVNDTVMKRIGANYKYDESSKVLTISMNGIEAIMVIDSLEDIKVTENGVKTLVENLNPVFKSKENNMLYMQIDILETVFKYDLNYDAYDDVYTITDKQSMVNNIDKNFSIINKSLFKFKLGNNKSSINTKAALTAALILYGDNKDIKSDVKTVLDITENNGSLKIKGKININAEMILDLYKKMNPYDYYNDYYSDYSNDYSFDNIIKKYNNMPFEIIYNSDNNMIYLKCEVLNMSEGLNKNVWLSQDADYIMEYYFYEITKVNTIGELIYNSCYGDEDECADMTKALNGIIGDKRFTKTSSNGIDTYSTSFNQKNIEDIENVVYGKIYGFYPKLDGKISFSEDSNGVKEIHFSGNSEVKFGIPINISLKGDITDDKTDIKFEMAGELLGKITASITSESTEGNNSGTVFLPPAGETVVEY